MSLRVQSSQALTSECRQGEYTAAPAAAGAPPVVLLLHSLLLSWHQSQSLCDHEMTSP